MKKYLLSALVIVSTIFVGCVFSSSTNGTDVKDNDPEVLAFTKSVKIPDYVTFAGDTIVLDRYDLYERYDREINSFTYLHGTTMLYIKRANRFFPIIEPILKENGIPDDFKYLAVIESNLDPRIVSPAKAAGLWQFMPKTATEYGLEVSKDVDERYAVEKSTLAACKYLNQAYKKYGSWASVALSYNAGQGRISSELGNQLTDDATELWLVEETYRYYFRMVAIKQIFENPRKYGFVISADQLYKPMAYKKVEVTSTIDDLAKFAKDNGITYAQLKEYNSWLRDRKLTVLKGKYTIHIPTEEALYYSKGKRVVHDPNWVTE